MLRICCQLMFACAIALSLASPAGAAGLSITTTTFGWDPLTQQPTAIGQTPISQYPALAVNQEFVIVFNSNLTKDSIDQVTARIETVPASELAPLGLSSSLPGGLLAPVVYTVKKNKLILRPAVLVTNGQISFGFAPKAFYRLTLKGGNKGIKGSSGTLAKTIQIRFRTTDQVVDPQIGAPVATVSVVDADAGTKQLSPVKLPNLQPSFVNAEVSPAPEVRIKFNELVKPNTVVDAATGGSPNVSVEIDADGLGSTLFDRTTVPGTFELTSSQKDSTLIWNSLLDAVPGDSVYVVTLQPLIEDIVGNSVFSLTGDIGITQVFAFRTKVTGSVILDPIEEEFLSQTKFDAAASSADWGASQPDFLITGAGGGTGEDGVFIATSPIVVLPTSQLVGSVDVPRVYNFSDFTVPSTVTVRGEGPFPLVIRCTSAITINGTLDVSGATPVNISPSQVAPGLAGTGSASGGDGGLGGSVTFGSPDFVSSKSSVSVPGYADSANVARGLAGQVTTLSAFQASVTLSGGLPATFANATNGAKVVGLWLQSNVGTGADTSIFPAASPGGAILHNHPTFKITSFSGPVGAVATFGIESGPGSATYYGPLNQPGLDFYEFPPPPITKVGDPAVIGDLAGHGGVGEAFTTSGGKGSAPLSVAQDFITQVRSGGGGGGGSRVPGEDGEDSPTFGTAEGTLGGTGGTGAVAATLQSSTATTLTAQGTPFAGLSLGPGVDPDASPASVVYPSDASAYVFEIVSNTNSQLTIKPISLLQDTDADVTGDSIINLSDVTGLAPGATMRIEGSLKRGGSGGGGSGVHVAGTAKTSPAPTLNLPNWTPGVGGGGGGGSVILESADRVGVAAGGRILARGGNGGRTTGPLSGSASGGGGGGGGSILLRSTDTTPFAITVSGLVDAQGGVGGLGFVEGGIGGDGRVRFENRSGNLISSQYLPNTVVPELLATDLGFMVPGLSPTVALSKFFFSGALTVDYTGFTVNYEADVNGVHQTGLVYTLADFQANVVAPFTIEFNDAGLTSNGSVDPATIDLDFTPDPTTLSGSYIRFRIELESSVIIGGQTFENVKIDTVSIAVSASS